MTNEQLRSMSVFIEDPSIKAAFLLGDIELMSERFNREIDKMFKGSTKKELYLREFCTRDLVAVLVNPYMKEHKK